MENKLKIGREKAEKYSYYLIFFSILIASGYYISELNHLSLWGDELWLLYHLETSYSELLKPGYLGDPNYPTIILLFKLASFLMGSPDPNTLVWINFFNVFLILIACYVLRKIFELDALILFLALLISSEYFLRILFEIKTGGFSLGLSSIFSAYYLKHYLLEKEKEFYLTLIFGLILSTIHPFSGLFVCSSFFFMFFYSEGLKKYLLILSFLIPILFLSTYSNIDGGDFWLTMDLRRILNTGAFVVPFLVLCLLSLLNETKNKFKHVKEHILILAPIILSLVILLGYSYVIRPIYQARYFITFFPLACFFFLLINKNYFNRNKHLLISICLISVIFFYGPRSLVPYTNYEDLIVKSHYKECAEYPIFFNKTESPGLRSYFDITFNMASKIYSPDYQRKLISYKKFTKSIKPNSQCRVIGISGQGSQDLFKKDINQDLEEIGLNVISEPAEGCLKKGCGQIWYIN